MAVNGFQHKQRQQFVRKAMMPRLKIRGEFTRAANSGTHASAVGLVLQAYRRNELGPARIGFTTSKKVGNAVRRNRARRRLRALADSVLSPLAKSGYDYVLIGRSTTVDRNYDDLIHDLEAALSRVHSGRGKRRNRGLSPTADVLDDA